MPQLLHKLSYTSNLKLLEIQEERFPQTGTHGYWQLVRAVFQPTRRLCVLSEADCSLSNLAMVPAFSLFFPNSPSAGQLHGPALPNAIR